jgi:hypothetical protein
MRSIRLAAVACLAMLLPVALFGWEAPASAAVVAHPIAGNYSFTVHWTDPVINDTTNMDVAANGSVSFGNGDVGTWEAHHKRFTMFVSSATYHGKKNKTGLAGTMSNSDGNSGTWTAVRS